MITGRNPVYETLQANRRDIFRLLVAIGVEERGKLAEILALAQNRRLPLERVQRQQLDALDENHQGVALEVSAYAYSALPDILDRATERNEPLFVLVLDSLQNPQNLGTLLRTAEAVGVHGVLLPLRRTADITPAVVHASSGATEHLLVAQMNLAQGIDQLKEAGAWVIGLDSGERAQTLDAAKLDGALALVVGSEGEGMRELTRRSCDMVFRLPMRGQVDSLNAAVAGSIVLYLALETRLKQV